jgi:hypothetical protein
VPSRAATLELIAETSRLPRCASHRASWYLATVNIPKDTADNRSTKGECEATKQVKRLRTLRRYERFWPDGPWGFADPGGWKCSERYCEAWGTCPGGRGL